MLWLGFNWDFCPSSKTPLLLLLCRITCRVLSVWGLSWRPAVDPGSRKEPSEGVLFCNWDVPCFGFCSLKLLFCWDVRCCPPAHSFKCSFPASAAWGGHEPSSAGSTSCPHYVLPVSALWPDNFLFLPPYPWCRDRLYLSETRSRIRTFSLRFVQGMLIAATDPRQVQFDMFCSLSATCFLFALTSTLLPAFEIRVLAYTLPSPWSCLLPCLSLLELRPLVSPPSLKLLLIRRLVTIMND